MKSLPRFVPAGALICGLVLYDGTAASSANTVTVESKSVAIGAQGVTVAIKISNDVPIQVIVLPLEIRSITPGSFITGLSAQRTPGGRLDGVLTGINIINTYPTPDGNCGAGQSGGFRTIGPVDAVSPDGVLFVFGKFLPNESPLAAGRDLTIGSLMLTFDVTNTAGRVRYRYDLRDPRQPCAVLAGP